MDVARDGKGQQQRVASQETADDCELSTSTSTSISFGVLTPSFVRTLCDRCWGSLVIFRGVMERIVLLLDEMSAQHVGTRARLEGEQGLVKLLEEMYASRYSELDLNRKFWMGIGDVQSVRMILLEAPQRAQLSLDIHGRLDALIRDVFRGNQKLVMAGAWPDLWKRDVDDQRQHFNNTLFKFRDLRAPSSFDNMSGISSWHHGNAQLDTKEIEAVKQALDRIGASGYELIYAGITSRDVSFGQAQIGSSSSGGIKDEGRSAAGSAKKCLLHRDEVLLRGSDNTSTVHHAGKWLGATVSIEGMPREVESAIGEDGVSAVAGMWSQLNHPNVQQLYGVCRVEGHLVFVCERADYGDLHEFLGNYFTEVRDRLKTWQALHATALGINYLHQHLIVHGNLKCSNVVVGRDCKPRITGFQVSSTLKRLSTLSKPPPLGKLALEAPERLAGEKPSLASDVYSFGMCIIEAMTGNDAWGSYRTDAAIRDAILNKRKLPPRPSSFDDQEWELVQRMSAFDPESRPSMREVVHELARFARVERNGGPTKPPDWKSLREQLEDIGVALSTCKEAQIMNHYVYTRLVDIFDRVDSITWSGISESYDSRSDDSWSDDNQSELKNRPNPTKKVRDGLGKILRRFQASIALSANERQVVRLSASRAGANNCFKLHEELDAVLKKVEPNASQISIHNWKSKWEYQRDEQHIAGVESQLMAIQEEEKTEEDRNAQSAVAVRYELENHRSSYNHEHLAKIEQIAVNTTLPNWYLVWDDVEVNHTEVGEGGFARVYRGKWLGTDVAIKELIVRNNCNEEILRNEFRQEADTWYQLNHPHIVNLFGACDMSPPFFVCDFAGNGQMGKYLHKDRSADKVWKLLFEASLGLQYLHSRMIVHGDLKCDNILVTIDDKAKITDFGLSSSGVSHRKNTTAAVRWVAPECLVEGGQATTESDVYSFGMCILQAVGGSLPWGNQLPNVAVRYHMLKGKFPRRPTGFTDLQWELVKQMCCSDPKERLTMNAVVQILGTFTSETSVLSDLFVTNFTANEFLSANFKNPRMMDELVQLKRLIFGGGKLLGLEPLPSRDYVNAYRWKGMFVKNFDTSMHLPSQNVFFEEVRFWSSLHHPHVVELNAAVYDQHSPFVVCQLATHGNFSDYFCGWGDDLRNKNDFWRLFYEASLGLNYLHSHKVVHGELRCRNLLVDSHVKAKVTGFSSLGFDYTLGQLTKYSGSRGYIRNFIFSDRWKSPEEISRLEGYGDTNSPLEMRFASDVYSLGMCIIEMFDGIPLIDITDGDGIISFKLSKEPYPRPEGLRDEEWTVVEKMIHPEWLDRISLQEAIEELKRLAGREQLANTTET